MGNVQARWGLSSCTCKCRGSQDMMKMGCSWWCPMSPILDGGSLWLWDLHYWQNNQCHQRERVRQPLHAVVHYQGGATAGSRLGMAVPASEGAETLVEGASGGSPEGSIDKLVTIWESVCLGPFQAKIIEGWVKPLLGYTSYMMITPLRVEGQSRETKPLPLGFHILHAYTHLKNSSGKVSLVVRNMSDSHIFLKKGVPGVQVVSASLVPPTELSPKMEATLGVASRPEPLSVAARQEKVLEKLDLDGLAHWSPENAVAVRELVLAYHDVFTLESNELGCTSAIEHEICIKNDEPFKEWFWGIPLPLLEEVRASL